MIASHQVYVEAAQAEAEGFEALAELQARIESAKGIAAKFDVIRDAMENPELLAKLAAARSGDHDRWSMAWLGIQTRARARDLSRAVKLLGLAIQRTAAVTSDRPLVELGPELGVIRDQIVGSLHRLPEIYSFGGRLQRWTGQTFAPHTLDSLLVDSADAFVFMREQHDALKPSEPPRNVLKAILDIPRWGQVPQVEAVSHLPVLRADGSLHSEPGYDADTRILFCPPAGWEMPDIPENPTQEDAHAAGMHLLDHFGTFPLKDSASKSALLALMLTPVCRDLHQGISPLFVINANIRGSGKSLIARSAMQIATGERPASEVWPSDEPERRKKLDTVIFGRNPAAHLFDDVKSGIGGASLDMVMTCAGRYIGRLLGTNTPLEVDRIRTAWIMTCNGAGYLGDAARRSLPIELLSPTATPEDRPLDDIPFSDLTAERQPELFASLITMARAWLQAGRPTPDRKGLGSFEQWSRVVRSILIWAGFADPLLTRSEMAVSDEGAVAHETLVHAVSQVMATGNAWQSRDLFEESQRATLGGGCPIARLRAALEECGVGSAKELGQYLNKIRDRPTHDGLAIRRLPSEGARRGSAYWTVAPVTVQALHPEPSPEPSSEPSHVPEAPGSGIRERITALEVEATILSLASGPGLPLGDLAQEVAERHEIDVQQARKAVHRLLAAHRLSSGGGRVRTT